MKNVTITLDEKVARWARIRAAEHETSLSRYVGEVLKGRMLDETSYESSLRRFMNQEPSMIRKPGTPYPSRDEIHDRSDLR